MLRFLTDEDFNGRILSGVLRRLPDLDILHTHDVGLRTFGDTLILAYAAEEGRLMLTHDGATMPPHADRRVVAGLTMPGIVVVNNELPLSLNINEIVILALASFDGEWEMQTVYLPL